MLDARRRPRLRTGDDRRTADRERDREDDDPDDAAQKPAPPPVVPPRARTRGVCPMVFGVSTGNPVRDARIAGDRGRLASGARVAGRGRGAANGLSR
jgi:hypothetical protein